MIKLLNLSLIFTIGASSASVTPPTFAGDFTMNCQSDVMLKQGVSKHIQHQGDCCSEETPGCQLQGMFSADKVEQQQSMNLTRRATMCGNGPCILASLYNVGKEMMLSHEPKN